MDSVSIRLMQQALSALSSAYEDMCDKDEEIFGDEHLSLLDAIEDKLDQLLYLQVLHNRRRY